MTPEYLMWSAQSGIAKNVKRYLRRGGDPDVVDRRTGGTALHTATLAGHPDIVSLLLGAGADTSARNAEGLTPLDVARRQGRTEIVGLLQG